MNHFRDNFPTNLGININKIRDLLKPSKGDTTVTHILSEINAIFEHKIRVTNEMIVTFETNMQSMNRKRFYFYCAYLSAKTVSVINTNKSGIGWTPLIATNRV